MYAKSLALASAVAMAASVAAEHPRIYFPREVKREYHNSTITSPESSSSTPDTTTSDSSTTKRDLLSDLISEILGSDRPKQPSSTHDDVTTVVVDKTVVIGGPTSGSGLPEVTVLPTTTTKKIESKKKPTTRTRSPTDSGIVIGPTGIVTSSTSEPTKVTSVDSPVGNTTAQETTASSTTGGGILDPIGTLVSSLLAVPSSTSSSPSTSAVATTSSGEQPISQNSTAPTTAPTTSETATGLLPILTSLLPIGGTTTTTSGVESLPNATSTDVPVTSTTSSGPVITDLPTTTSTDIPIGNTTSTGTVTSGSITSGTATIPTSVTDIPITNGTISVPPTDTATTVPTTSLPSENSTVIVAPTTTSKPSVIPTTTAETTTVLPTTTTAVSVTSSRPTATIPNTQNWLPTTIVIEPTTFSFSAPTASPTGTTSQSLPTTIPKIIMPDDPNKPAPEGTVQIQIGFLFPLNYVFVSSNTVAAAQIFKYLPLALAGASGLSVDKMQISKLVPYNTQSAWGYVTTIAQLNYPATLVDTLQMDLWSPNSAIYNNADPIVRNLTALINQKIDIHGNINNGGPSGGAGGNGGGNNNNDAFGSGDQGDQSPKQKGTTVGIAMGALGLSVMYGAAMFVVARRYKRKRQGHRRASSITSSQPSSEMRYNGNGSPALMGGAIMSRDTSSYGGVAGGRDSHASGGNSARTANISAPVATENSLGWN